LTKSIKKQIKKQIKVEIKLVANAVNTLSNSTKKTLVKVITAARKNITSISNTTAAKFIKEKQIKKIIKATEKKLENVVGGAKSVVQAAIDTSVNITRSANASKPVALATSASLVLKSIAKSIDVKKTNKKVKKAAKKVVKKAKKAAKKAKKSWTGAHLKLLLKNLKKLKKDKKANMRNLVKNTRNTVATMAELKLSLRKKTLKRLFKSVVNGARSNHINMRPALSEQQLIFKGCVDPKGRAFRRILNVIWNVIKPRPKAISKKSSSVSSLVKNVTTAETLYNKDRKRVRITTVFNTGKVAKKIVTKWIHYETIFKIEKVEKSKVVIMRDGTVKKSKYENGRKVTYVRTKGGDKYLVLKYHNKSKTVLRVNCNKEVIKTTIPRPKFTVVSERVITKSKGKLQINATITKTFKDGRKEIKVIKGNQVTVTKYNKAGKVTKQTTSTKKSKKN
jgi:hypothetical protein